MGSRLTLALHKSQKHKNKFHEKEVKDTDANDQLHQRQQRQQSYEMNSSNFALNFYPEACSETAESPSRTTANKTNYHSILKKRGTLDSITLEIESNSYVQRDRSSFRSKRKPNIVKV